MNNKEKDNSMTIKESVEILSKERDSIQACGRYTVIKEALDTLIEYAESGVNEEEPLFMQAIHKNQKPNPITDKDRAEALKELPFILSGEYRQDCGCEHCKNMPKTIQTALLALRNEYANNRKDKNEQGK